MNKYANLLIFPCFVWLLINIRPQPAPGDRPKSPTQEDVDKAYLQVGDFVILKDDATAAIEGNWGRMETLPPAQGGQFVRLHITDKTKEQAEKYLEAHMVDSGDDDPISGEPIMEVVTAKKWKLLRDNLPAGVRTQLNQTGVYETDWATIRTYIYDKVLDITE